MKKQNLKIGLSVKVLEQVAQYLQDCLATTYALYLKTQNFHWNLEGPGFFSLHLLFEKQYEEMASAVDEIAERIRALGHFALGSFSDFSQRSLIPESKARLSEKKMLLELVSGHEKMAQVGREFIQKIQLLHDEITIDLLIKRVAFHEKAAWMLRSHLSGG